MGFGADCVFQAAPALLCFRLLMYWSRSGVGQPEFGCVPGAGGSCPTQGRGSPAALGASCGQGLLSPFTPSPAPLHHSRSELLVCNPNISARFHSSAGPLSGLAVEGGGCGEPWPHFGGALSSPSSSSGGRGCPQSQALPWAMPTGGWVPSHSPPTGDGCPTPSPSTGSPLCSWGGAQLCASPPGIPAGGVQECRGCLCSPFPFRGGRRWSSLHFHRWRPSPGPWPRLLPG